jgi:hypothetical protein
MKVDVIVLTLIGLACLAISLLAMVRVKSLKQWEKATNNINQQEK